MRESVVLKLLCMMIFVLIGTIPLNKIDFDGNRYTFNGKSVLLKDLIGDEKQ